MENAENPGYREAVQEVEDILHQLENEDLDIDNLSGKVNRALQLIKVCKAKLRNTEEGLEKALRSLDTSGNEPDLS